jgi:hypothetical protein
VSTLSARTSGDAGLGMRARVARQGVVGDYSVTVKPAPLGET